LYDFENTDFYTNLYFNANANFFNTVKNDFRIGPDSEAAGKGDPATALLVPLDVLGIDRTAQPALGAYQQVP
jgi:hypothetical protein